MLCWRERERERELRCGVTWQQEAIEVEGWKSLCWRALRGDIATGSYRSRGLEKLVLERALWGG